MLFGLDGREGDRHRALRYARHLRGIDEAHPAAGVDHYAVEDVLALGLLNAAHLAELDPVGGEHGRAAPQHLEGDGAAVVHAGKPTAGGSR